MVFTVSSFPLAGMLDECLSNFSKPQFRHFENFIAGLMLNGRGEKNIMDIATNALDGRYQSSLNRFLHGRKCSPEAVDCHRLERHSRNRSGGVVVLDDILIEKSGHKMDGTRCTVTLSTATCGVTASSRRCTRTATTECRCTSSCS
jgi:hypothetical protein